MPMMKKTDLIPIIAIVALVMVVAFGVKGSMKQQRVQESEQARDAEQFALVRSYLTETIPKNVEEAYENSNDDLITGAKCSVRFKTRDESEGAETEDEFHSQFQGIFTINLTAKGSFDRLNTYEQSQKLQEYARNAYWYARDLFYEFPDYTYKAEKSTYPLYLTIGDVTIDFEQDWEFDVWVKTPRNTYEYYAFGSPMFDGYEINGKYTSVKDEDEEAAKAKKSGNSSGSSGSARSSSGSSSGSGARHSYSGSSGSYSHSYSGPSGSYSSSGSDYDSADDYADENYEDYMDSGEFDNEDDAWDAAYDDFEDGDAD